MRYSQDLRSAFVTRGPSEAAVRALCQQLTPALHQLQQRTHAGISALLDIAQKTDDIPALLRHAREIQQAFKHVVVCGAGGAGLSGYVLTQMQPKPWPVSLHYLDNIDPHALEDCLSDISLKDSCFLIISKSGETVETLGQCFALYGRMQAIVDQHAARHFYVVTTPQPSPLYQFAQVEGIAMLPYEAVGGRFSVFATAGLLPAAVAGVDITLLRRGASELVEAMDGCDDIQHYPPAMGAALQYACAQAHIPISVMLPYSSRLAGLSSWYRQSWSESLGKNGFGTTPIRAVGTTDQHSQLQLYLDGPKDKLFTFITLPRAGSGPMIGAPNYPTLDYIQQKTLGDVMAAEQKATLQTLIHHGCPIRHITVETLDIGALGALLMHFTLEIIFTAALAKVNPLDQPAVEQGKHLARDYLLSGQL